MLFLILYAVYLMSFVAAQWLMPTDRGGRLRTIREAPSNGAMNYLVAGMLNQPQAAYDFLLDELSRSEGITLVEYRQQGWIPREMAEQILRDITESGYRKVRIFTVSVGDKVARYLEYWVDDAEVRLEVVAINPCPAPQVLHEWYQKRSEILGPLLYATCILVGWLSLVPVIPTVAGMYSLMLLTDQVHQTANADLPTITRRTIGAVLSTMDQYLDNDVLFAFYERTPCAWIETKHADFERHEATYLDALNRLLEASDL